MTCLTRGSSERRHRDRRSRSSAIFSSLDSVSIGSIGGIERAAGRDASACRCRSRLALRDRARGAGCFQQRRQHDLVGIREAGLFAGHRAHADALLDRVVAFLDDAVLEHPGLLRECWKYRSAASTLAPSTRSSACARRPWSSPPGTRSACLRERSGSIFAVVVMRLQALPASTRRDATAPGNFAAPRPACPGRSAR